MHGDDLLYGQGIGWLILRRCKVIMDARLGQKGTWRHSETMTTIPWPIKTSDIATNSHKHEV